MIVMCVKPAAAAAAAAADDDDDDDDDDGVYNDYNTAELPLSPAIITGANSSSELTRFNINDNDVDYMSAGANEAANNHNINDGKGSLRQLSHADNIYKNKSDLSTDRQLPTLAGRMSALRQDLRDTVTVLPLKPTMSSPWHLSASSRQQLNYVVMTEKRRLALQKQRLREARLRAHKLRLMP